MGEVLFSPFSLVSRDAVSGDWLRPEALSSLGEGPKGPFSTQFTFLQLQTGDASFSATAQNIGSRGASDCIGIGNDILDIWISYYIGVIYDICFI